VLDLDRGQPVAPPIMSLVEAARRVIAPHHREPGFVVAGQRHASLRIGKQHLADAAAPRGCGNE